MTSAKIRIRVGSMELEYEGDPSFLTGGIEALLTTMGDLSGRMPPEMVLAKTPLPGNGATPPAAGGSFTFSTGTIAAHLDAKSAPELVICAMAQLELVQNKASYSRSDILAEMKAAPNYFDKNMVSNMTYSLGSLIKAKRIKEITTNIYALSASERKKVEAKVAEIT
jgi:hypothetical protein